MKLNQLNRVTQKHNWRELLQQKRAYKTRFVLGGIALVCIAEYVITEAISASAWTDPTYSYARNFISDLGVSGGPLIFEGRNINSPIYWLMNSGFMVEGLLILTAAILLNPLFVSKASRTTVVTLALIHCIGMLMVAIVHGSPEAMHKPIGILHVIGAFLAIVLGNTQCICSGVAAFRAGAPAWFKTYSTGMGVLGILGLIALAGIKAIPPGITERLSVYTIIFWDITAGIFLLISIKKAKL
jgi:hypothetical membrane protein